MQTPEMDREYFLKLLEKYSTDTATPEEKDFIDRYYLLLQNSADVLESMPDAEKQALDNEIRSRLMEAIEAAKPTAPAYQIGKGRRMRIARKLAVAATIIFIVTAGTYIYFINGNGEPGAVRPTREALTEIFVPGTNKAILQLDDGSSIELDNAAAGKLANQHTTQVIKLNEGLLSYELKGADTSAATAFNKIVTPRGGEYQVILPDGTKAWLNADSYLKFPVMFGKERNVEMGGEVYFEVARDKKRPFKVSVNGTVVEALGTSFNINAYLEEQMQKTTLIEGSVRVSNGSSQNLLQPGEQAQVSGNNSMKVVKHVNQAEVMAWRNGLFFFNKADIKSFMRQLERWYNIKVQFEGKAPDINFNGKMERNLSWEQLLRILKEMGVNYRVEGRVLTISQ